MNSEDLRAVQKPLKEKYKENPDKAFITLKAKGRIGEGITCKIDTGSIMREAGLHPATGGNGLSLCSGDMLLEALAACAGVTLNAVAAAIDVKLYDANITAEGDIDFKGTLAVSKESPVGFKNIRLIFELFSDADKEKLETLIKLTERYCVVYQTLKNSPQFDISYTRKK